MAGASVVAPAQAAEVVSSNIVGYDKVTLSAGLNLLSAQFVNVGDATALSLGTLNQLSGQPSYDEEFNPQTTIRVFTGDGYDYYGWTGNLTTENPDMAEALAEELELPDPTQLNNKWLDSSNAIADEPLAIGEGFWLYAKNANGTLTTSGEVPADTEISTTLVVGLNLVAYPWPMDADLANISVSGQPSYDEEFNPQTTIRVFTGDGYDYYGWTGNLTTENPDMAEALAEELELPDPTQLNNKWLDSSNAIVNEPIAIGKGFWIYAKNPGGKVTFTRPASSN